MRWFVMWMMVVLSLAGCLEDDSDSDGPSGDGPDGSGDGTDGGDGGDGGDATGDGDAGETEAPRETVQVTIRWEGAYAGPATASSGAAYDQGTITVPANSTVELRFVNEDPATGHDIAVEGFEDAGGDSDTIAAGEEVTITFDVGGPQETAFYCTIPGHRGNGMEGTFIVE